MVVMKLEVKESSENLSNRQLLPTPAQGAGQPGEAAERIRAAD